jgi:SAM-dependent methyltransferase
VADLPTGFLPDLRALRSWPDLGDSLWREPYLVAHTFGELYRVVRSQLDPPLDVLELGCGTGYTALELARAGCRVTAIDSDGESIALARKAHAADPLLRDRPVLSYEVADLSRWQAPSGGFDVVIASRVLHHVPSLHDVLTTVGQWLRPGGRLVCVEFAYDRFDRRCAGWLYQVQGLLQASGAYASGARVSGQTAAGIERIWNEWWRYHEEEHKLNTFDQLTAALRSAAEEQRRHWLPYLYWEALEDLELRPEAGATVARFLRDLEAHLIAEGELPGVLFSWVGERDPAGNEGDPG